MRLPECGHIRAIEQCIFNCAYRTKLYFDIASCAPRIEVPTLVSVGFIDQIAPPAGLFIACNRLRGYKEVAPLVDAGHNHEATYEQQAPFNIRAAEWLDVLSKGGDVHALESSRKASAVRTLSW